MITAIHLIIFVSVLTIGNIFGCMAGMYFRKKKHPEQVKKEEMELLGALYHIGLVIVGLSIPLFLNWMVYQGAIFFGAGIILLYNWRDQAKQTSKKFQLKCVTLGVILSGWTLFSYLYVLFPILLSPTDPFEAIIKSVLILFGTLAISRFAPKLVFMGEGEINCAF